MPFVWEISPFDETLGDTTCVWSEGGEHFYGQFASYTVNEDSLYISFPTYIKYYNIEGGLIQKIDMNKGEILWQTALDLRNSDRQEQLQSIKIIKNGDLEIYALRMVNPPKDGFPFSSSVNSEIEPRQGVRYTINKDNGSVIKKVPEISTIIAPIRFSRFNTLISHLYNDTIVQFSKFNGKILTNELYNLKDQELINSYSSKIKFEIAYDTTRYFPQSGLKLLSQAFDTLITLNLINAPTIKEQDTINHQTHLTIFDHKLEIKNRFSIEGVTGRYRNINLLNVDKNYIYLKVDRNFTPSTLYNDYLILDYNGNLIQNVRIEFEGDYYIFEQIIPDNNNYGAFFIFAKNGVKNSNDLLYLSSDGTLKLLKRIKFDTEFSWIPKSIIKLSENMCILNISIGNTDNNGIFQPMCFNKVVKLDFNNIADTDNYSSNSQNRISIFPNPVYNLISIKGLESPANITIYNLSGKLVKTYENIIDIIDIESLIAGMYIFEIKTNKISERHKIVKVE